MARPDGSRLFSGWRPFDEVAETPGIQVPPTRGYQTLAGLLLHTLRRDPAVGETLGLPGVRVEVPDLDGPRIDKVLTSQPAPDAPADSPSPA